MVGVAGAVAAGALDTHQLKRTEASDSEVPHERDGTAHPRHPAADERQRRGSTQRESATTSCSRPAATFGGISETFISGSQATGVVTGEVEDADERRIPGGERGRAVGDHERVTR